MYRDVAQERREKRSTPERVARAVGGLAIGLVIVAVLLALWMAQVFGVGIA